MNSKRLLNKFVAVFLMMASYWIMKASAAPISITGMPDRASHNALAAILEMSNSTKPNHICQGVLVGRTWILTTGGCVWKGKTQRKNLAVRFENSPDQAKQFIPVSRWVLYPGSYLKLFNGTSIALLKLAQPAPETVAPLPIASYFDYPPLQSLAILGRNYFYSKDIVFEYYSFISNIDNYDDNVCRNIRNRIGNSKKDMICINYFYKDSPGEENASYQNQFLYSAYDKNRELIYPEKEYSDFMPDFLNFGNLNHVFRGTPLVNMTDGIPHVYAINLHDLNLELDKVDGGPKGFERSFLFINLHYYSDWIKNTIGVNQ